MTSDTTGRRLTDAEIADICEALDPIPDDSLDGMLTWIGPDWPTMQRIMADLIATRAELAELRRAVEYADAIHMDMGHHVDIPLHVWEAVQAALVATASTEQEQRR